MYSAEQVKTVNYVCAPYSVDLSLPRQDYQTSNIFLHFVLTAHAHQFVSGQETTANVVSFVLLEVGRRPKIYKK